MNYKNVLNLQKIFNTPGLFSIGILQKVDQYLLENYPVVWRSRIHYFLFYSGIVTNVLLLGIALGIPVTPQSIFTESDITRWVWTARSSLVVVVVYWFIWQRNHPVGYRNWGTYLKITALNSICLFLLYLNSIVFTYPLIIKSAQAIPESKFQEEYQYHASKDFWTCTVHAEMPTLNEASLRRIQESLDYFGVAYEESMYGPNLHVEKCKSGYSSLLLTRTQFLPIKSIMQSLEQSRLFLNGTGRYQSRYIRGIPYALISCVLLSVFLTFLLVPSPLKERIRVLRKNEFYRQLLPSARPGQQYIRRIEERPLLWSTQVNEFLRDFLVYALILALLLWVSSTWIKSLYGNMDRLFVLQMTFVAFLVFTPLTIAGKWVRSQARITVPYLNFSRFLSLYWWYLLITLTAVTIGCALFASFDVYQEISGSGFMDSFTTLFAGLGVGAAFLINLALVLRFMDGRQGSLYFAIQFVMLVILMFSLGFVESSYYLSLSILLSAWAGFLLVSWLLLGVSRLVKLNLGLWVPILFLALGTITLCILDAMVFYEEIFSGVEDYAQNVSGQLKFCGIVFLLQLIGIPLFSWPLYAIIQHWGITPKSA